MPELLVTDRSGNERRIKATVGLSIMETVRDAGFDELIALCGGCCSCATCHIYVASRLEAELPPMTSDEDELLESSSHRTAESRLSCQLPYTEAMDGLSVTIAPED